MRQVAVHRFLRSSHIVALLGGSHQQVLRRLQLLFHHGYLERPRAQIDYYYKGGSQQIVYGLAKRGAGRLRRDLNMPFEQMNWSGKKEGVGRIFLEHALMVSDFLVSLELACTHSNGHVRFIPQREVFLPPSTAAQKEPFRWSVIFGASPRVGVVRTL